MTMSKKSKKEYVEAVSARYVVGNREAKRAILEEVCELCGYHRKHAIRMMSKLKKKPKYSLPAEKKLKRRGRKPRYSNDPEFCIKLKELWFATDQMCAPNLKAAIPEWLPHFEQESEICSEVKHKLLVVSAPTIGRILEPSKCRTKRRGGTKPGSLLRTQIPIRTDYWDVDRPGYVESDTVAHCGGSMAGEFVWTATFTDIDTTWTELRTVWNKLSTGVLEAVQDVEKSLPFPLLGFDTDNGAEFINHALVHYFAGKFIPFTRSREYHKNDNAHVEQKNYTHARQLLGYDRIDCKAVVPMLNDLLRNEVSQLRNHFYPSLKLAEKIRIQSRLIRKYPPPQTPYARVLASPFVEESKKAELRAQHAMLNPLQLKRTIEVKLRRIWRIVRDEHLELMTA